MNPVQYIILNEGAGMSPGKAAAQAAHASVEAVLHSYDCDPRQPGYLVEPNLVRLWRCGGKYAKVVLGVPSAEALRNTQIYLAQRDIGNYMVIDEGRTEIEPMTPTAIGTEIVDKDNPHVRSVFSEFKLYQGSVPSEPKIICVDAGLTPQELEAARLSDDPEAFLREIVSQKPYRADSWWRRLGRWLYCGEPTPMSDGEQRAERFF